MQAEAIKQIIQACEVLGWVIAFPQGEPDDDVPGMVIGTQPYIDRMVQGYDLTSAAEGVNEHGNMGSAGHGGKETAPPDLEGSE
jgi:hypothetical protein